MKTMTAVAAALLAAALAAPALARPPLTRDMVKQRADLLFEIADVNHDGVITRAEFDGYLKATNDKNPAKANAMFAELDPDNSGRITLAQVEADALAKFDRADTNHDGVIQPEEVAAYRAAKAAAAGAPTPDPAAPGPGAIAPPAAPAAGY